MTRFGICAAFAVALLCSCSTLTEDVEPTATCVSGTRWVGGDTGHEEMHPGLNCVGCHRDNDGPPLALGGTIYGLAGQEDDCFGEPGVTVLVKDANGKVFEFVTNAAGNFYLEGDESQVAKPYNVKIRWPDPLAMPAGSAAPAPTAPATPAGPPPSVWDAKPAGIKEIPMAGKALTGDCGACHKATPTVGSVPTIVGGAYAQFEIARSSQQRPATDFPLGPAPVGTGAAAPAPTQ